jgi:hypothetical protein
MTKLKTPTTELLPLRWTCNKAARNKWAISILSCILFIKCNEYFVIIDKSLQVADIKFLQVVKDHIGWIVL